MKVCFLDCSTVIFYGNKEAVQILLDYGADVNAVSHSKIEYIPSNTTLHATLAGERSFEVIKLLLEHHARTDISDSNGHTSLETAESHNNNSGIMTLLLAHSVNNR